MTCIVGVVDRSAGNVLLASDSLGVTEGGLKIQVGSKLWRSGEFVFGLAGTAAQAQAARDISAPEGASDADRAYAWLKLACVATHFYTPGAGRNDVSGWTVLIAKGMSLWQGGSACQLMDMSGRGSFAIGSGGAYALGAMHAVEATCTPEELCLAGMETACALDVHCAGPTWRIRTGGSTDDEMVHALEDLLVRAVRGSR